VSDLSLNFSLSATKTFIVGLLVGVSHLGLGVCVAASADVVQVTHLALPYHVASTYLGMTPIAFALLLMVVGGIAIVGSIDWLLMSHRARYFMFAPQQFLLMLQLVSIVVAVALGHYPDGYVPRGGGWFILADQIQAWILAVSHSIWLLAIMYFKGAKGGGASKAN
jgi:hypothetical protein